MYTQRTVFYHASAGCLAANTMGLELMHGKILYAACTEITS